MNPKGKFTKTVATKLPEETFAYILSMAQRDEVTVSSVLRRLVMRSIAEDAGNLGAIDASREMRR